MNINIEKVRKDRSYYWAGITPGIRVWAENNGCLLDWNGFIPCLTKGDASKDISLDRVDEFISNDDYEGLYSYIHNLCEGINE